MRIKRIIVPKFWTKNRKDKKWAIAPSPGPHKKLRSIPIGILLRDVLKTATNAKEAKHLLNKGSIKIDGRKTRNLNYGVGIMDSILVGEKAYRIIPTQKGLEPIEIPAKDANLKIGKVVKKTMNGKKIQLNLHDGKNVLTTDKKIKVGDTIILTLPDMKIQKHLPLEKNVDVIITSGRHSGVTAKYKERKKIVLNPDIAILEKGKETFETTFDYLMVVGDMKVSK